MMKRMLVLLPMLSCLCMTAARANWEYDGEYVADGWYPDDGARFVLSIRGGASYGMAKIKNDVGEMVAGYYYDPDTNVVISDGYKELSCGAGCASYVFAGSGNIGELKPTEDYKKLTFAAGASIGWVVPNHSGWRLELGWDRITEAEYNVSPLFEGDIALYGGAESSANVQSGSVHSTVSTDIISAMAFYDFFEGMQKPLHSIIPYIGLGAGYANSTTELQLNDLAGDLSLDTELQDYGEGGIASGTALKFYKSKTSTSNIAGVLAIGASYGINDKMFLDFGARFMYLPKIKWALSDENGSLHRDWFSATNMIYTNVMLGLRFEF